MPTVSVQLPHHSYDIVIEPGRLDSLGAITAQRSPHARCALISDSNVGPIHGPRAFESLKAAGYSPVATHVPAGESHKNLETVRKLYATILDARLERLSPVVALGGGVIGDTVGFVASTYLRGVPFVQCPTTLLAMVDSSVGGKVGVNVPQGKNLIGSFYHPTVVVVDPLVLQTLPPRELRCGLAECVKHGVIRDETLFEFIRENHAKIQAIKPGTITELVQRNVAIKAAIVMEDEKETGVRAHLNFGHTFAHAIEATAGYGRIEHGEAVALGMVAATHLAVESGLCKAPLRDRIVGLLNTIGLPTRAELPEIDVLMQAMALDKKVKDGKLRFVLPLRMGEVAVTSDVGPGLVREAWAIVRS